MARVDHEPRGHEEKKFGNHYVRGLFCKTQIAFRLSYSAKWSFINYRNSEILSYQLKT